MEHFRALEDTEEGYMKGPLFLWSMSVADRNNKNLFGGIHGSTFLV